MKRFWKEATASPVEGGFAVFLDGRRLRTPARIDMVLPRSALAEALAEEWGSQGEKVRPHAMPLMRFVSTAIDRVRPTRMAVLDEVCSYAGMDLLCYRADRPVSLVERQARAWQPLLDWLETRHGARLNVTDSIAPLAQPPEAIAAVRNVVDPLPDFELTALHAVMTTSGSAVIGLALLDGRIDAAEAADVCLIDETYQIEHWGEEAEATRRLEAVRGELREARRFLDLLA